MDDTTVFIELGSQTRALTAERILSESGIGSAVGKKEREGTGCVWGLWLRRDSAPEALARLRARGIAAAIGGVL